MTVSVQICAATYLGNAANTQWDYPFPVPLIDWLYVKTKDSTGLVRLVPPDEYSVTGIGTAEGGYVIYPLSGGPLPIGWRLRVGREVPLLQNVDIVNQETFYPEVLEGSADYQMFVMQQQAQRIRDIETGDLWFT